MMELVSVMRSWYSWGVMKGSSRLLGREGERGEVLDGGDQDLILVGVRRNLAHDFFKVWLQQEQQTPRL